MSDEPILTYVEIDISPCELLYGMSPCAAAVGVTGAIKCFNTRYTCQDPNNFNPGLITLRFVKDAAYVPDDIPAIASLLSVDITPGRISLGQDLGQRTTARVVFKDHPWADTGEGYDKYVTERGYEAWQRGTYWGKLRARHLSLQGRPIRVITGRVGQSIAQMRTIHLFVDDIDGPLPNKTCAVTAKDIFTLADGDKSMTPPVSNGFLLADITDSTTSVSLGPSGVGAEYPLSGHVTIGGNETCAFTRSGDALTLMRAQKGTTASAHQAEDRVQLMRSYAVQPPSVILEDLFKNDAGMSTAWLPVSEWEAEEQNYLQRSYSIDIAEPTATNKIAAAVIQQAGLAVFPDNEQKKIKMLVLRGVPATAATITQDSYKKGSLEIQSQPDTRISEVIVRYGLRNPLLRVDDRLSYRSILDVNDADALNFYTSDAIKEINGTLLPPFAVTTAQRVADILLGRFSTPPRAFSFKLSRSSTDVPQLGEGRRISWPGEQDATGASASTSIQIVRINPYGRDIEVEADEMLVKIFDQNDLINRVLLISSNERNLFVPSMHNAAYPPLTAADVTNGVNLTVIVQADVTVGSDYATASGIALDFGTEGVDWPTGFQNKLRVAGRIRGKGARGANASTGGGNVGEAGGTGLKTRTPLAIELESGGEIKGGGGGGGGGGRGTTSGGLFAIAIPGGPGGGGAGDDVGQPGTPLSGSGSAAAGTLNAGGAGNGSSPGGIGGKGGDPGQAGQSGSSGSGSPSNSGNSGGAAGRAIDGISFCTFLVNDGVRAGPEVN